MKSLDDLIADYIFPAHLHNGIDKRSELKSDLLDWFEELIGEDNYITKLSGNSRLDQSVSSQIAGENKLRQELRSALRKEREK